MAWKLLQKVLLIDQGSHDIELRMQEIFSSQFLFSEKKEIQLCGVIVLPIVFKYYMDMGNSSEYNIP